MPPYSFSINSASTRMSKHKLPRPLHQIEKLLKIQFSALAVIDVNEKIRIQQSEKVIVSSRRTASSNTQPKSSGTGLPNKNLMRLNGLEGLFLSGS